MVADGSGPNVLMVLMAMALGWQKSYVLTAAEGGGADVLMELIELMFGRKKNGAAQWWRMAMVLMG